MTTFALTAQIAATLLAGEAEMRGLDGLTTAHIDTAVRLADQVLASVAALPTHATFHPDANGTTALPGELVTGATSGDITAIATPAVPVHPDTSPLTSKEIGGTSVAPAAQ